jgi:hypothetical protein
VTGRAPTIRSRGLVTEQFLNREINDLSAWAWDAVVFPAVADVGPADMDVNPSSADPGWRNGVSVATATSRSATWVLRP